MGLLQNGYICQEKAVRGGAEFDALINRLDKKDA